jgi:hypothetical protein
VVVIDDKSRFEPRAEAGRPTSGKALTCFNELDPDGRRCGRITTQAQVRERDISAPARGADP